MTPAQTEIIFEEYIQMNSTKEEADTHDVSSFDSRLRPESSVQRNEGAEPGLGSRIRAELDEKLRKKNG